MKHKRLEMESSMKDKVVIEQAVPSNIESEEVKIGNWTTRLPSDICTNRDIFDEIFSLSTWNNVLKPEQQERIMKMLPAEVRSNPEAARQTIEELLTGTLTVFNKNPLQNFYNHLEQGQYDPEVSDTKCHIRREWKKESLRQLKSYHQKLLEDIIVSRQKHLHKIKVRSAYLSKCAQKTSKSKKAKPSVPSPAEPISEKSIPVKTAVLANNTASNKAQKPPTGTAASSKKRKIKEECCEVIENGPPAKKALKSKVHNEKKTTDSTKVSQFESATKMTTSDFNSSSHLLSISSSSNMVSPPTSLHGLAETKASLQVSTPSSITQQLCQTVIKQEPSISNASENTNRVVLGTSITTSNQTILPAVNTSTTTTLEQEFRQVLKSSNSFLSGQSKSSPILASQLQASPQVIVKVEPSELGEYEEADACRITLNYQKMEEKSSEDDLETSSDEFEGIQPTIGFETTVHSSPEQGTSPTIKVEPREPSLKTQSMKVSVPTSSQKGIASKQTQVTQESTYLTTTKSLTYSSPILIVNAKRNATQTPSETPTEIQPSQIFQLQCKGSNVGQKAQIDLSLVNACNSMQQNSTAIPISSVVCMDPINKPTTSNAGFLLKDGTTSSIQQQSMTSIMSSEASKVFTATGNNEQPGKSFRISSEELCGRTITLSVPVSSFQSQSTVYSIPTSSKGLHFQSAPMTSTPKAPVHLSVMPPSVNQNLSNVHFVNGLTENNLCNSDVNSSTSLLDNDDLNLNLGNLGIGLGLNINLGGLEGMSDPMGDSDNAMKMEMDVIDKIGDLSVLEGNPFDSIPNLSDELDGLDLDLVDGLCDFEGLLSDEKKYPSFFSLIRDVLCSTRDHRMNLMCLEKTVRKWSTSPGATLNAWFLRVSDWNIALVTALNFLAGNYQDVHPEDFVPYIEYKYKTKYYQWIGAGRDGDNNLTPLCSIWMDNLDRLPSIKKLDGETEEQEEDDDENEDCELTGEEAKKKHKRPQTPPPPRCTTDWSVRASTRDEKAEFRKQERIRFENPHKAFTYNMHGYESVVGPVKGVYSSQVGMTNKARGHSLLVDDRPPYVTILALVRDAVARLPNGEGTRSEICEMLRDSAFLAPDASSVTLNSVVSGALDRLHYERDPCVRYDSHKKSWIYLHRDRTQDQFERLHHNRSYTKSTKCRNTTGRKSRKAATKGAASTGSASNQSTSPGNISLLNTTTSSSELGGSEDKADTAVSQNTVSTPASPSVSTPATPTFQGGIKKESTTESTGEVSKTSPSNCDPPRKEPTQAQVPTGSVGVLPAIRLTALPECGTPLSLSQDKSAPTSTLRQQFILQTTNSPVGQVSSSSPVQIRTTRPIQIQNLPTSTSTAVSIESLVNVAVTPTSTQSTSNALQPGPILLNPSNMLRLASALRLSHVRFPGAPGNLGNTLRLPPHRILLTRGMIPGQTQTQGVLLGQTSSGQTVILSTTPPGAIGGFQTLNSISTSQFNDISLRALHTSDALTSLTSSASTVSPTHSINLVSAQTQGLSVSSNSMNTITAASIQSQANIVQSSATTILQSQITGASSTFTKSAMSGSKTTTTSVSSVGVNSASSPGIQLQQLQITIPASGIKTSTVSAQGVPSPIPTIQTQSVANNSMNQQSQIISDTQQQNSDNMISNNQNQTPITSPIIIRSAQGDIIFPGNISLGRAVPGFKLIPLQMGNKAVLAKIIPPTPRMTTSVTGTTASSQSTTTPMTPQPQPQSSQGSQQQLQ